nr:hypothetical protein [Tanacetum cinerariifolium]
MAVHTERMERFKKPIFKQREEMFRLFKELTTSRTPKKVLVREEAKHPITKHVNVIYLVKIEKEKIVKNKEVVDKIIIEPSELNVVKPIKLVEKMEGTEYRIDDDSDESMKEELTKGETRAEVLVEIPSIGRLKYVNALIDQGSDVNVIPISIYSRLTSKKLVGTNITLSLASHSYIYPLGIAEDVLIVIAGYVYPVDLCS